MDRTHVSSLMNRVKARWKKLQIRTPSDIRYQISDIRYQISDAGNPGGSHFVYGVMNYSSERSR
jgi:hypothetical protein